MRAQTQIPWVLFYGHQKNVQEYDPLQEITKELDREESVLTVRVEKRRYNKPATIIAGFPKDADLHDITRQLKTFLATGGTAKDGEIVLNGDHFRRAKEKLEALGYHISGA
ncbi:MAG: translation initiation factor [Candidatus Thermoplasmatota archaeon]|jgi:translation initiation factor 1|nr:translation initiation factor [Candidatus Thermoplasmatota archaeon]